MLDLRLKSLEKSLDRLFNEVSLLQDEDINKAHLSRYLCVRTSGYMESVTRILIAKLCDGTSPKSIQNYVQKRSKYITNLGYKKMSNLLAEFDQAWAENFSARITEQQKSSMNSVVSNRNNIAHGNSDSISFNLMKQYYIDVKEVANLLEEIIKK
jgi:hypothetical protein